METSSGGNHPIQTQSTQEAEESNCCIICSEAWKRSGSHCAVSLACGHMFGKKCIERWIQDRLKRYGAKGVSCPMCMKPARQTEIRHVMPSRIVARDTGNSDKLKAELDKKKGLIKEEERALDHCRLALAVLNNQIRSREQSLKHKLESTITTPLASDTKPDTPIPTAAAIETPALPPNPEKEEEKEEDVRLLKSYRINFSHRLSEHRNVSRVMAIDTANQTSYISFKSTDSESGVISLNPQHPVSTHYIPIHAGLIKDVKHNNNGLLMTTSLDKSLKFTSTTSNAVTDTISLPLPGWSCCFDPNDDYKVACGLSNSAVRVYDRRHTKTYVQELCCAAVSKTPLHSLFFKSIHNASKIYGSNLNQTFVWNTPVNCDILQLDSYTGYNPYSLSDHGDQQILLSSRNRATTKHQILDISSKSSSVPIVSTIHSPAPQKGFARTYAYIPQDTQQSPIICYGDEVSGTLNLSREKHILQHFNIHSCPLDISLFDTERLAFLTDNRFFLLSPIYTT